MISNRQQNTLAIVLIHDFDRQSRSRLVGPCLRPLPGLVSFSAFLLVFMIGLPNATATPTAMDDDAAVDSDTPTDIDVLINDTSTPNPLDFSTLTIVTQPVHGTATPSSTTGEINYVPDAGYAGTDSFTYTIKDTAGVISNTAFVDIEVRSQQPPVANDDGGETPKDTALSIDILINDWGVETYLDPSTVFVVIEPANGSYLIDPFTGAIQYTPDPGFTGNDFFSYVVQDENGNLSNEAIVMVTVNRPPQITDFIVYEDSFGVWNFEGNVNDENPGGLFVHFGGILTGNFAAVQPDGSFIFSKVLEEGVGGLVTAQTEDEYLQPSNVASDTVN